MLDRSEHLIWYGFSRNDGNCWEESSEETSKAGLDRYSVFMVFRRCDEQKSVQRQGLRVAYKPLKCFMHVDKLTCQYLQFPVLWYHVVHGACDAFYSSQ